MSLRIIQGVAIVLLAAIGSVATAQSSSELKTPGDVSGFMQSYYRHPPDRIGALISALPMSGMLQSSSSASPLIGFFSEIFAANPNRLPEWQTLIAKRDEQTKAVLDQALKASKSEGVLNSSVQSTQLNDACWGGFFASGNPKYVDKVVISYDISTSVPMRRCFPREAPLCGPWRQTLAQTLQSVQQSRAQRSLLISVLRS